MPNLTFQPEGISGPSSTIELEQLTSLIGPEAWRSTPATFASYVSQGRWKAAKHLLYISSVISRGLLLGNARFVISCPPRHGKSQFISRYTNEWLFDVNPAVKIMLTSYGAELASSFGRMVRDDMRDYYARGLTKTELRDDSQQVAHFLTTAGGEMMSVGLGGPITGRGADVLEVDDYVKNAKEAASQAKRDDDWDWLTSTAMTRLEPNASVLIIATRWNIDDIIGRIKLLGEQFGNWVFIDLPAVAEENDLLGRQPGEALWPDRYPITTLSAIKQVLSTYFWMALYQQKPIPRIAGTINRSMMPVIDILPHVSRLRFVRAWDFAGTEGEGDWTVGHLIAEDDQHGLTFLVDVVRGQWGPAELERNILATASRDAATFGAVQIHLEQEPGSSGKIAVDYLVRKVLKGFPTSYQHATGPKTVRSQPLFAAIQNGLVRVLKGSWNNLWFDEVEVFPDGPYDDQVDAASAAYNKLHEKKYKGVTWATAAAYQKVKTPLILPNSPEGLGDSDIWNPPLHPGLSNFGGLVQSPVSPQAAAVSARRLIMGPALRVIK